MDLPNRQRNRLERFDYNSSGSYFITICVAQRKQILSQIVTDTVGTGVLDCPSGVLDCPKIVLSNYGRIAEKYINQLNEFYNNISVDKYIIMPDHIHFILTVDRNELNSETINNSNSIIARFVGTFKRYSNKEYGCKIWQPRYYDHVIRNLDDYNTKIKYIESNPINWIIKQQSQDK